MINYYIGIIVVAKECNPHLILLCKIYYFFYTLIYGQYVVENRDYSMHKYKYKLFKHLSILLVTIETQVIHEYIPVIKT